MHKLMVDRTRNILLDNGTPFFYLADTAWSAFSNASIDAWLEYLRMRKLQGFNAVQINTLWQHDASRCREMIFPFERKEDGTFDYHVRNERYFERVSLMTQMVVEQDLVPSLVLLWCNYVPDTWLSVSNKKAVMPYEAAMDHVRFTVELLKEFAPVFIIGGDTDFRSEETIRYFRTAFEITRECAPECLRTIHICGPLDTIAESLLEPKLLDFIMYQSGHRHYMEGCGYAFHLAEKFSRLQPPRPVINAEPCYEGLGTGGALGVGLAQPDVTMGRFTRQDVRRAAWQSILSGASAGVAYGAHGIWSWHHRGDEWAPQEHQSWPKPFDWQSAVQFPGAWDMGFARHVMEQYRLQDCVPAQELLHFGHPANPEFRAAATDDRSTIAIYLPFSYPVAVTVDLRAYTSRIILLELRRFESIEITFSSGLSHIRVPEYNGDMLIVCSRKENTVTTGNLHLR